MISEDVREAIRRRYVPGVIGLRCLAREYGISATSVLRIVDPDYAERTRQQSNAAKRRRVGICKRCGGETRYNGHSVNGASRICASCHRELERTPEYQERLQKWPARRIIAAIQDWAAIYGEPPAVKDWSPTGARYLHDEKRAHRFESESPRWPWFTLVVNRFGTWNAAIKAAGFEPRAAHGGDGNTSRRRTKQASALRVDSAEESTPTKGTGTSA